MARYRWKTAPDGRILVSDDTGQDDYAPTLTGNNREIMLVNVIGKWRAPAETHAMRMGIPAAWLLGMIFRESGGNARARNPEKRSDPTDDGIGLLQITSRVLKQGFTDEQLFDPDTNIRIGASYVAQIAKIVGRDLPKIASAFNAGIDLTTKQPHISTISPWGFRETSGHILGVTSASNFAIEHGVGASPEDTHLTNPTDPTDLTDEEKVALAAVQFDLVAVAREADDEARRELRDTEKPPPEG